jgi:hypothetical protein
MCEPEPVTACSWGGPMPPGERDACIEPVLANTLYAYLLRLP